MSDWAKPGVKCQCINADWQNVSGTSVAPLAQLGHIYTIRDTEMRLGRLCLCFMELPPDHGYQATSFRPLVTRTQEQDVRAIKSMLRELPAETRLDRLLEALDE